MSAPVTAMYAALVSGGIPRGATARDLAWLEREHRFRAGVTQPPPRSAWHGRQAFLCSELLATMKESAP